ncbi:MAG: hypothetical protein ACKPHU_07755, partial [Planctomycetaceae bacterium]
MRFGGPARQVWGVLRAALRREIFGAVNLFKAWGFLPSSEPAIGRSQELATDGWCRRTAELPWLVELEKAACP